MFTRYPRRLAASVHDGIGQDAGEELVTLALAGTAGMAASTGRCRCDLLASNVDIIQIIGRALRAQPGKDVATIVVPIRLPAGGDDDEQLSGSAYGPVWRILRGLRAHDERVAVDLETAQRRLHAGADIRQVLDAVPWLHIVGDPSKVLTRLVRGSSGVWDSAYAAAAELAEQLGGAHNIRIGSSCSGVDVGVWVQLQRELRRRGVLHPARAARLEQINGWVWTGEAAADRRALDTLHEYAQRHGSVADNLRGASAFETVRYGASDKVGARMPWAMAMLPVTAHSSAKTPKMTAPRRLMSAWRS